MTPNEIKEEVGRLALEKTAEVAEGPFWSAINRAAAEINRLRPLTGVLEIYNGNPERVFTLKRAECYGKGKPFTVTVENCASCYFKISGGGEITVTKDDIAICTKELHANRKTNEYRIVIPDDDTEGAITVTVSGQHLGTIAEAILYKEKYSEDESDVPASGLYNIYRLSELAPDISFVKSVQYEEGGDLSEAMRESHNYAIPNGTELWLMKARPGNYRIYYAKRLPRITREGENAPIFLDEDLAMLMPLLVCYFVWLEDKPEIAEAMYTQYLKGAAEIKNEARADQYPSVQDVYGW